MANTQVGIEMYLDKCQEYKSKMRRKGHVTGPRSPKYKRPAAPSAVDERTTSTEIGLG